MVQTRKPAILRPGNSDVIFAPIEEDVIKTETPVVNIPDVVIQEEDLNPEEMPEDQGALMEDTIDDLEEDVKDIVANATSSKSKTLLYIGGALLLGALLFRK